MPAPSLRPFATLLSIETKGSEPGRETNELRLQQIWAYSENEAIGKAFADVHERLAQGDRIAQYKVIEILPETRPDNSVYLGGLSAFVASRPSFSEKDFMHVVSLLKMNNRTSGTFLGVDETFQLSEGIDRISADKNNACLDRDDSKNYIKTLRKQFDDLKQEHELSAEIIEKQKTELELLQQELAAEQLKRKDLDALGLQMQQLLTDSHPQAMAVLDELGVKSTSSLGMMCRIVDLSLALRQAIDFLGVLYTRVENVNQRYPSEHQVSLQEIPTWKSHLKRVLADGTDFTVTKDLSSAWNDLPASVPGMSKATDKTHWASVILAQVIEKIRTSDSVTPDLVIGPLTDVLRVVRWLHTYQKFW